MQSSKSFKMSAIGYAITIVFAIQLILVKTNAQLQSPGSGPIGPLNPFEFLQFQQLQQLQPFHTFQSHLQPVFQFIPIANGAFGHHPSGHSPARSGPILTSGFPTNHLGSQLIPSSIIQLPVNQFHETFGNSIPISNPQALLNGFGTSFNPLSAGKQSNSEHHHQEPTHLHKP